MITILDAFKKFKSRLELNDQEQADVSRRQQEIRTVMDYAFDIESDFLTGSYKRWTKTKPLKDVDIFCVLGKSEPHYRKSPPSLLLAKVVEVLIDKYGKDHVECQHRSVTVNFGVEEKDGETNNQVMSFDVVPAFRKEDHYEIPDTASSSGWIETNPKVHADLAVTAQKAYAGEWKAIVRVTKSWNRYHDKPIKPSFLIEVMALQLLHPPFGGDFRYETKALFASLAKNILRDWPDPAGLGPNVSDRMSKQERELAQKELCSAELQAANAIRLERQGKAGEALRAWRELFGPLFPLS